MEASYILVFVRITLGLTFSISILEKVQDISSFIQTIKIFNLFPASLSGLLAYIFLLNEFVISLTMVTGGPLLIWGFLMAFLLLLAFTIGLFSVLIRNMTIPCNCFGTNDKTEINAGHIFRNFGFMICSLGGMFSINHIGTFGFQISLLKFLMIGIVAISFTIILTALGGITKFLVSSKDIFRK